MSGVHPSSRMISPFPALFSSCGRKRGRADLVKQSPPGVKRFEGKTHSPIDFN